MPIRQDRNVPPVTPALMAALQRTVSPARLQTYLAAAGYDQERAVRLYLWNAMVGQSFHFPIQATEVALRNCIHEALQAAFGTDWWSSAGFGQVASQERLDNLREAERRIRSRRRTLITDQVVASLSLGFWVGMLHGRYNPTLWSRHLRTAFPCLPGHLSRKEVHDAADRILELRNRIFYQVPEGLTH